MSIINEKPGILQILDNLIKSLKDFYNSHFKLLLLIKSEFFSTKTWPKLHKLLVNKKIIEKKEFIYSNQVPFGFFIENNIYKYHEDISLLVDEAKKEYEIEKKMEELENEMRSSFIEFVPHPKDNTALIMKGYKDLLNKFKSISLVSEMALNREKMSTE